MSDPQTPKSVSVSAVVPVHNEAGNIVPLFHEIDTVLRALGRPYEIVYINDGSVDGSLAELQGLLTQHPALRVIDLDGNFGEAAALCAGFAAARGEWIITLDGDGQNDPSDIPQLLEKAERGGYRVVSGWRRNRQEDPWRRVLPSRLANLLIRLLTGIALHDNGCGLKIYRRQLVSGAALPRGFNRFLPAILGVTAAEVAEVAVSDRRRQFGASHYGLGRVLVVLRDLLALPFILTMPHAGERLAPVLGLMIVLSGLWRGSLVLSGLGLVVVALIGWNLRRYNHASRTGVFRVRAESPPASQG